MTTGNHYQILGLDPAAPPSAVAAAVERLEEHADALAYISPERSRQLWEHIREIKRDLLSGPEARSAYLRQLREGTVAPEQGSTAAAAVPRASHIHWPVVVGALAAVLAALIVAAVIRYPHGSPRGPHRPVALAPRTSGPRRNDVYLSGHPVLLAWSAVPHAILYRLQIAASPSWSAGPRVFRHVAVTWLTTLTSYRITVIGAQQYSWRVQPNVGGTWRHFSATQHFTVSRPAVGTPRPLRPADGAVQMSRRVRLCWSAVPGAVGYRLALTGAARTTIHATCTRETLRPGSYFWSVAALVRGAQMYVGTHSPAFHVLILERYTHLSSHRIAARLPGRRAPARRPSPARQRSTPPTLKHRRPHSHPVPASHIPVPHAKQSSPPPVPESHTAPPPAPAPPQVAMAPPARPTPTRHTHPVTLPRVSHPPARASHPHVAYSPPRANRSRPPRRVGWGRPRPAATVTGRGGVQPTARPTPYPTASPLPRPTSLSPSPAVALGPPPAPTAAPPPPGYHARSAAPSRPVSVPPYPYRAAPTAPAAPRPAPVVPPTALAGPGASVPTGPLRRP